MKNKLVSSTLLATAAFALATAANAQLSTRTSVEFFPKKDRYARGETVTAVFTVRYVLPNGAAYALPGAPIYIGDWIGNGGWTLNLFRTTNALGQCSLNYRIPTNQNWDNISIVGNTAFSNSFRNSWFPSGFRSDDKEIQNLTGPRGNSARPHFLFCGFVPNVLELNHARKANFRRPESR